MNDPKQLDLNGEEVGERMKFRVQEKWHDAEECQTVTSDWVQATTQGADAPAAFAVFWRSYQRRHASSVVTLKFETVGGAS